MCVLSAFFANTATTIQAHPAIRAECEASRPQCTPMSTTFEKCQEKVEEGNDFVQEMYVFLFPFNHPLYADTLLPRRCTSS